MNVTPTHFFKSSAAVLLAVRLAAPCLLAGNLTWDAGGGADTGFMLASNWNPDQAPASGDTLTLDSPFTAIFSAASGNVAVSRMFVSGSGVLKITGGSLDSSLPGNYSNEVGRGSPGIVIQSGGTHAIGHRLRIGSTSGGNGIYQLSGGLLSVYRNVASGIDTSKGAVSIDLGEAGAPGLLEIAGGAMETRSGIAIGATGVFSVSGSTATSIGIGSKQNSDGFWIQKAGSVLKVRLDGGGATRVFIDQVDNTGGKGDVVFDSGSLLDVGFLAGSDENGSWDIMSWEGTLTNNGLALAPGVDPRFWNLSMVDTDSLNGPDTLRVTFSSAETTKGTSRAWLGKYYSGLTNWQDFENADNSDSDGDGSLAWEEYLAGTDPTDGSSFWSVSSTGVASGELILTWDSVAGRKYQVEQNPDLSNPVWTAVGPAAIGHPGTTAYAIPLTGGASSFYRVSVGLLDTVEIPPEADAQVSNGANATINDGSGLTLTTIDSGSSQSEFLLRFTLPPGAQAPDSAVIYLNTTSGQTDAVENSAHGVIDNAWTETGVTWNNMPATGDELDAWVTGNDRLIKIDVTQQVIAALAGDGILSISIRSPHDIGTDGTSVYYSRESGEVLGPKLVLRHHVPKVCVAPGESIQNAIDAVHAEGGGQVVLMGGNHGVSGSLTLFSDITLRGQGAAFTSILMDPSKNEPILIGTGEGTVNRDITIRDLTLNGQQDPAEQSYPGTTDRATVRGETFGILFTDQDSGNTFERIRLDDVVITRCAMGVHMKGVDDLRIQNSAIRNNGCLIGYDHNTYFRRATYTLLKNLDISDCKAGNGFNLSTNCNNVILDTCNASNNHFRGIRFEANDGGSRMMIINCITNGNGLNETQPGIRVANVPDFTILGCTANGNGDNGIYVVGSSNGLVKNNTATGNVNANYRYQNVSSTTYINNN